LSVSLLIRCRRSWRAPPASWRPSSYVTYRCTVRPLYLLVQHTLSLSLSICGRFAWRERGKDGHDTGVLLTVRRRVAGKGMRGAGAASCEDYQRGSEGGHLPLQRPGLLARQRSTLLSFSRILFYVPAYPVFSLTLRTSPSDSRRSF
jgi:hypothetical protein